MENLKKRFHFSSPIVQAQAVRNLVAAVLKENGSKGQITASTTQGPALEAIWEQCCSDNTCVSSACCDALVLLVDQGHADLHYVLNTVLNHLPSARNFQGLIKVIGRLLQKQADHTHKETLFICPYSIRSCPHPFITALENRVDCWPVLLLEVDDFIQQAAERDKGTYITMLLPFLRYLYCEPQRLPQHAILRHRLQRALLPLQPPQRKAVGSSVVSDSLLLCLCHLVPHMQVDSVEAVLELCGFVDVLLQGLLGASGDCWRTERVGLLLQLLCSCQQCLQLKGDCRPLLTLMQQLLPSCQQELALDELILGVALLLLDAPAAQQTGLLQLALRLVSQEEAELSPWLSSVLVLPVLQLLACSSLTELLADHRTHSANQSLAHSLLHSISRPTGAAQQLDSPVPLPLTSWHSELKVALSTLHKVTSCPGAAADWLQAVSSSLSSSQRLSSSSSSSSLVLILTHLVLASEEKVCRLALDAVRAVAAADPCQGPSILPVLLFKLAHEKNPSVAHAVLSCLPSMGTHMLCFPMVLQTLDMLASVPKLRAVAVRLMTALWKKQDRVYPELQRVLGLQDSRVAMGKDTQWELMLSRAACLRDICKERPYQHGGDMLAATTLTLQQCARPDLATPAALAMQALQELCRAEVVDIISTWRSLGPGLSCESRPVMVEAIAELLALVSQLTVKSQEYEKLREEVVSFLWKYALSKDPQMASCGYKALAEFSEMVHTVLLLPEAARPPATLGEKGEDSQSEESEEEKDLSVPGSSYVKLMALTSTSVLPAFQLFLTSLVKQEMIQMPRGIYFSALRGACLHSEQGKTVAGIPSFILKAYEKNKQPGLKPGLAAAMLLCYELPVQTDREGRPIDRFLISRSRSYQHTLTSLIHEVNIQPSEWHHALILPKCWSGFMNRAFHAVLQGRRADLKVQQKQCKENPQELQYHLHCAWLWSRDQLTDIIKAATKDSPVVQGNSILALSGLAAVVTKYESSLPAESDGSLGVGPEFVGTVSWLTVVLDTLLCISSSSYQARGPVLPCFLHRSYSGENTASAIARSCASLAFSSLVPVLVVWQRDAQGQVLAALRAGLPGSPTADNCQAVQLHSGLALGMVLSSLHQQNLSDVSAQNDSNLFLVSLEALESCSFNTNLENNTGCILGLALVLAALCGSSQATRPLHVVQTLEKLLVRLQDRSGQGRMLQEVLAYSVACVGVSAFSAGLIEAAVAEELLNTLRSLTEESQQTPGFSLALGLAVHGMSASGHGKAEDLLPRLMGAWIQILQAEGCPTMLRLSAVNGLVALVGSESYLVQKSAMELSTQQHNRLNEVIRSISQVISVSGAIGLQSNSAHLLGHLHLAHMSTSHSHTAVPQDFSYLSEKSVIRAVVEFITVGGKKGPDFSPAAPVETAVTSLASVGASFQYPPVNWNAVLGPLMRLSFGDNVQLQCVALAAAQAQSSKSASLFLGSWLSPPLVHTLSLQTRAHLYETLGTWMKHVAEDKLQVYVETLGLQHFHEDLQSGCLPACRALLHGLARAMAQPNPPNACWTLLCSVTEKIVHLLPNAVQDDEVDLYVGVAKCLSEMSDTEIDRIARVSETQMEKTSFLLAYLTSRGRVPLLCLNDVIAGVLKGWPSHRVGWILLHTLYQCGVASANTGASSRMEWLLELMGHIRNVAYGAISVTCGDIKQATDFLFQLFSAAVVSWGDHVMPLLLGVRAQWFPGEPAVELPAWTHRLYGEESLCDHALPQCLLGLSHSLPLLVQQEPWTSQTHKFTDWLFSIIEGPEQNLSAITISTARAALLSLKSSPEFKKKAVWTRAHGW